MEDFLKITNKSIDTRKIKLQLEKKIQGKKDKEYLRTVPEFTINKNNFLGKLSDYGVINTQRVITSHRPFIGSTLVKVRKILDEEIRRSFEPIIKNQEEFNKRIVEHVSNELKGHTEFDIHLRNRIERLERMLDEANAQINENIKKIFRLQRKLEDEDEN